MNRLGRGRLGLVLALALLGSAGCQGPVGPTEGTVRFDDGSVVRSGKIEFRRRDDGERFVSRIANDGSFAPTSDEGRVGLPEGSYEVVVVQVVLTEDLRIEDHQHGTTVPRRYADYYTSDLRVEVAADQTESIEVVLEADG